MLDLLQLGHMDVKCWYRMNHSCNYNSNALIKTNSDANSNWFFIFRATSHVTNDGTQLFNARPYNGTQQVAIVNGDLLPIHQSGQGLLPTLKHQLLLNSLLHVHLITHNLIFVHKLASKNFCSITFDSSNFFH